ncbi:MAG: preprotein translocase subunit SecY [Chloroflexia bacterium]|nr:preprotein translocase subunit SecY [Chloroflexia bacterium]
MFKALVNAIKIPDLRRKIVFTLAMLVFFRLISHIPVPMVNSDALRQIMGQNQLFGLLDLVSGGALVNFSIAAMGVYPYITATIVMQLLQPIIPALEELSKQGEQGQQKINKWSYWITIPLAALQGFGQVTLLSRSGAFQEGFQFSLFDPQYMLPSFSILASMIAGTMVLIWVGDLITEQGIGNGLSMIIFGGIVSRLPDMLGGMVTGASTTTTGILGISLFLVIALLTIVGIVLIQEGRRELRVQYSRRVRGTKLYGGGSTTLPLRVNMAGMIPLIFAQSFMVFPGTVASYLKPIEGTDEATWTFIQRIAQWTYNFFNSENYAYWIILFFMVIGFTYFYTIIVFSQTNMADNLRKSGGFIPGYRPGPQTERLLNNIVTRLTLLGSLFLGVVAVLPFFVQKLTAVPNLTLSATSLLILVGVAVDTMKQLESQLLIRRYEGFL